MRFDDIIIGGDSRDWELGLSLLSEGRSVCLIAFGGIPSAPGVREPFVKAGGTLFLNDRVREVKWASEGTVGALYSVNLGNTPLEASRYFLASGRFVSGGLVADADIIREPLFGADMDYVEGHSNWCADDFFDAQPFEEFGVEADGEGHLLIGGKAAANVYAWGVILCSKCRDNGV